MLTDYKFWYIKRDDDGFIVEATIRFFEGDITTEMEPQGLHGSDPQTVTRYRRSKRLAKVDLPHFSDKEFKKETSGADCVFYTQREFGQIKTDDELRDFLNKELKKDLTRTPIDEQKEKI